MFGGGLKKIKTDEVFWSSVNCLLFVTVCFYFMTGLKDSLADF